MQEPEDPKKENKEKKRSPNLIFHEAFLLKGPVHLNPFQPIYSHCRQVETLQTSLK